MKIEAGKTYKTRSGRKVRVLCTDLRDATYPVVGVVDGDDERVEAFTADGRFNDEQRASPLDLVEEWREPMTCWATVAPNGDAYLFRTERHAREHADEKGWRLVKLVEAAE